MPLLSNVTLNTLRAQALTATGAPGATSAPTPYLVGVVAGLELLAASEWTYTPSGAVTQRAVATVDAGTDIATDDQVTAITTLDGAPWPADHPNASTGAAGASNEVWRVTLAYEGAAALLPERVVHLERVLGGGPLHP